RDRIESRAPHQRRGKVPRRPAHCGLRPRVHGAADDGGRAARARAHNHHACAAGRPRRSRQVDRGEDQVTYLRPADRAGALRLHLNENTGGCSYAVIEAIRQITTEEVAMYPDYTALSRECAEYLGVREAQLVLTNGLDEGLFAATVSAF